jgi:molecular chaperone GrpE
MDSKQQDSKQNEDAENSVLSDESAETSEALESEQDKVDTGAQPQQDAPEMPAAPDEQVQIAELTDRLQRTMADFDNFRKRTQKERSGVRDDAIRQTIEKLLPVLDNFVRAMDASNAEDPFVVGMQMILKQFIGTLNDEIGVCEIESLGESFNPEVHFAVSHVDDDQYGDNEVIEILQKGYKYKDKVIRPSMVRVAN